MGKFPAKCRYKQGIPGLMQELVGYMGLSIKAKERTPEFQCQTPPETPCQRPRAEVGLLPWHWQLLSSPSGVCFHHYAISVLTGEQIPKKWNLCPGVPPLSLLCKSHISTWKTILEYSSAMGQGGKPLHFSLSASLPVSFISNARP